MPNIDDPKFNVPDIKPTELGVDSAAAAGRRLGVYGSQIAAAKEQEAGACVHWRLIQREPVQRDDFFPGQLVGGTPAHGCNIAQRRQAAISAARGRPNARPA
jgi:hypothetical protein